MKDKDNYFGSMEMHAISSAAKPACTWAIRDAIQDCRESCGGHGYLKGILKKETNKPQIYLLIIPFL